jgi:WYL_2, Sm-like SH3 beta-barrel fold
MEQAFEKVTVEAQLAVGLSKVSFYKLDGTVREMICTKDMSIIPADRRPTTEGSVRTSDNITVYDVEADGWRSFILGNLIAIDKE